ncbi:hypothetical protein SAMN04489727_1963 [Amycolatopsis tolypomycina]|uniref:Excreted virulence factor EspC, type VII ESX diderm n=1 Tax=Amycolatopsis tolypomycina TaxID=208445 RepID=A0A1H4JKK0_9PSEU|nr:hypothetical protein [Amycolatopsis tolypomycina]SEB46485.1 hypothetical protein SAMN04489727_1963 [Amycolatopsis tolypomycina]
MTHDSSPHPLTSTETAATTAAPRSAAEHYAAAETLFARARAMHPELRSRAADEDEYRRCLDWADMHLRLAEALTAGAGLLATQLRLKADGYRLLTHLGSEAYQWDTLLKDLHRKPEGTP